MKKEYVLAIESSCDDSCVCVMDLDFNIIYEKSISQIDIHAKYGGVVPELASRSHMQYLQILMNDVANFVSIEDIVAICPTFAPGLIGGLLTAVVFAKGICHKYKKKLIPIHHLQGHLESVNINKTEHVSCPNLTLLISGGHCQFIYSKNFGDYEVIGKTIDDSVGEAFDKCGKMIGLEYPAGAMIEKLSKNGKNIKEIGRPMSDKSSNFSFSGFKTNVLNFVQKKTINIDYSIEDLCFSIQDRICENLCQKTKFTIDFLKKTGQNFNDFIICGGVSANKVIITEIEKICYTNSIKIHYPSIKYATDNATMIAVAGVKNLKLGHSVNLEISPQSRLNIQDLSKFYSSSI